MVLSRTISTHTHITARPVPDRVGQELLLQPHDTVWKALQTHHRRFDDGVEKQGMQEGERQQQVLQQEMLQKASQLTQVEHTVLLLTRGIVKEQQRLMW